MIIRIGDIGEIEGHHCLNFLFIIDTGYEYIYGYLKFMVEIQSNAILTRVYKNKRTKS